MLTYPILSQNPEFPINTGSIWDTSVLRYVGKVEQRVANWVTDKELFPLRYKFISTADKELLRIFFELVHGPHRKFNWLNPETAIVHVVKFQHRELGMRYVRYGLWDVGAIRLIEVI